MKDISTDLYIQYLENLQSVKEISNFIAISKNQSHDLTEAVLRKYIKLLRVYFKAVLKRKLVKTLPASTAVH